MPEILVCMSCYVHIGEEKYFVYAVVASVARYDHFVCGSYDTSKSEGIHFFGMSASNRLLVEHKVAEVMVCRIFFLKNDFL
jgi:hypothetical protein